MYSSRNSRERRNGPTSRARSRHRRRSPGGGNGLDGGMTGSTPVTLRLAGLQVGDHLVGELGRGLEIGAGGFHAVVRRLENVVVGVPVRRGQSEDRVGDAG